VLAGYAQLRLARQVVADARLPWERPRPQPRLSPYRVRRGFPQLLCALGSPAVRRNPPDAPLAGPGPLLGTCRAVPGGQEAHQQAPQEAAHDGEGCLTGSVHPPHRRPFVDGQPGMPTGLNHKLSGEQRTTLNSPHKARLHDARGGDHRVGRSPNVIANATSCQWIALYRASDRAARMSERLAARYFTPVAQGLLPRRGPSPRLGSSSGLCRCVRGGEGRRRRDLMGAGVGPFDRSTSPPSPACR
jgi:hypothetical protein